MTNKQKWLIQNGFNSDGIIYLVGGGNTYKIKDYLKSLGFRFSSQLGWYSDTLKPLPAPYYLVNVAFDDLFKWEEKFNQAFPHPDIKEKIKNIIYINKEKKTNASKFIGTLKERVYNLPVEFKRRKMINGSFYVYTFKNEANILIWTTKKDIQLSAETPYLLTGTVAAYQELNNIKITKMTRCNIIERQ